MNLEVATATEKAAREVNQDRIFSKTAKLAKGGKTIPIGLFCVADGVGGLAEGEFAAQTAVSAMEDWWQAELSTAAAEITRPQIFEKFFQIFQSTNAAILEHSKAAKIRLGTTCTVLLIIGEKYYIAHAGDTRVYQADLPFWGVFTAFAKCKQLTIDHTRKAENSPKTKLTSCLGVFNNPKIFTAEGVIKKPCTFLVCSDGLYKAVSEKGLRTALVKKGGAKRIIGRLMFWAASARDNVSAVVVGVG